MFSHFDQVEYCNVDSDNLDRYCFNKTLLLPDLYKKIEDLVDKTALIKSLKEPNQKTKLANPLPLGQKKNICVFTVTCQKNLGSVGRD